MSNPIATHIVNDHTLGLGPDLFKKITPEWKALKRAFFFDRFGDRKIWLAADWSRDANWPFEDDSTERAIHVDDCEIRIVRSPIVNATFIDAWVTCPCYNWDGMLALAHGGSDLDLDARVTEWFDSIGRSTSLLRSPHDALYPTADGNGMRYVNVTKTVDQLAADVRLVAASLGVSIA